MKNFNGKAIRMPQGKAGEYAKYSCNFYVGCSNRCEYCYLSKGKFKATLGGDKPTLKKCFKDEAHALEVFEKELKQNLPELQKHGLFFSFTTDPNIEETVYLTSQAMIICIRNQVPVKILTKDAYLVAMMGYLQEKGITIAEIQKYIAFGFTLTGHDELEPNASANAERIETIQKLHDAGFKTWASIEPIIDFDTSAVMIDACMAFCDIFKIGLMSGKKYDESETKEFVSHILHKINLTDFVNPKSTFYNKHGKPKIYFKDSLLKQAGINRENLPSNCVGRDYNLFEKKENYEKEN